MAARFDVVSDDEVNAFSEQEENKNTKMITLCDQKIFQEFLKSNDETKVNFCCVRAEQPSEVRREKKAENNSI